MAINITHHQALDLASSQITTLSKSAQLTRNTAVDLVACFAMDNKSGGTQGKLIAKLTAEKNKLGKKNKTKKRINATIQDISTHSNITNTSGKELDNAIQQDIAQTYADQIETQITHITTNNDIKTAISSNVLEIFDTPATNMIVDAVVSGKGTNTLSRILADFNIQTDHAKKVRLAHKYNQTYKFIQQILTKKSATNTSFNILANPKILFQALKKPTKTPPLTPPPLTPPPTINTTRNTSAVFSNFGQQILQEEAQKAKEKVNTQHQTQLGAPATRRGSLFHNVGKRLSRGPVGRRKAHKELNNTIASKTSTMSLDDQYANEADALAHLHTSVHPEQYSQTQEINTTSNSHINNLVKKYADGTIATDADFKNQLDGALAGDPKLQTFIQTIQGTDNQLNTLFSPQYSQIGSNILLVAQRQKAYHTLIARLKTLAPSDPGFETNAKNAIKTYMDDTQQFPQQLFEDLKVASTLGDTLDQKIIGLKNQLITHTGALDEIQNQTINVALYGLQNKKLNEVTQEKGLVSKLEQYANKVPRYAKVGLYMGAGLLPLGAGVLVPSLIVATAGLKIRAKFANKHRALEELKIKDNAAFTTELAKSQQIIKDLSKGPRGFTKYFRSAYRENKDLDRSFQNTMNLTLLQNDMTTAIDQYHNDNNNNTYKDTLKQSLAQVTAMLDQYNQSGHATFSHDDSKTFGENLSKLYHQQKLAMSLLGITDINDIRGGRNYKDEIREINDEYKKAHTVYQNTKMQMGLAIAFRTMAIMRGLGKVKELISRSTGSISSKFKERFGNGEGNDLTPDPDHGGGDGGNDLTPDPDHGGGDGGNDLTPDPDHGGGDGGNDLTPDPDHGGGDGGNDLTPDPDHGGGDGGNDLTPDPDHGGGDGGNDLTPDPSNGGSGDGDSTLTLDNQPGGDGGNGGGGSPTANNPTPSIYQPYANLQRDENIEDNLQEIFSNNGVSNAEYLQIAQTLQDPNNHETVRNTLMQVLGDEQKVAQVKNALLDHAHESIDGNGISELRKASLTDGKMSDIKIGDNIFDDLYLKYTQYYEGANPISASDLSQTLQIIQQNGGVIPSNLSQDQVRAVNEYCFMKLKGPRRDVFFDKKI